MRFATFPLLVLALTPAFGAISYADDAGLSFPVEVAMSSALAKEKLRTVPVYMAGQDHGAVDRDMGVFRSNKATRAIGRSDQEACNVAFLSAIISLQARATHEGGDAVVDVQSVPSGPEGPGPDEFGCMVGRTIARVVLEGRVVSFK